MPEFAGVDEAVFGGPRRIAWAVAMLIACVAGPARAGGLRAGAAAVDITPRDLSPDSPAIIAGGFLEARADRVHDPLFVKAIVLDDGGGPGGREPVRIACVVVDSCMLPRSLLDDAKARAAARCGIPTERMMVSATHTHSAPAAMGCLGTPADAAYAARLPDAIAAAVVAANDRLEPAAIGHGSVDDWEHTHNRRWIRRADSRITDPFGNPSCLAQMHPGHQAAGVIGPSGPVDPQLSVLSLRTAAGRPLAVFANYSQHYFGAAAVSADYFGHFCRAVAAALGESGDGTGPFVCMLSQGTSGDLMWMDYGSPPQATGIHEYATSLARRAVEALARIEHRDDVEVAMATRELDLSLRLPDESRLAWARPIAAGIRDGRPGNIPEVYAREALILHDRRRASLLVQAIRIGDATIAALPNEVFAITGLKLRRRSPATCHFNVELANGAEGYIPPPEQHALGGYTTWPARTAGLEVGAEPRIVEEVLTLLEQVTGRPRRVPAAAHGPAAEAVLAARAAGYWRCDEDEGSRLRDAVGGRPDAALAGGFAWQLPGVGSLSGGGAALVAGPFSRDGSVNRSVHLAGGTVRVPPPRPGDGTLVLWTWLGVASGASERQGAVVSGLASEPLVARQDSTHAVTFALGESRTAGSWRADIWHQLAIVRRGDRVAVHVDGGETPGLEGEVGPDAPVLIGAGLQGRVDEIAWFDRALDAAEIAGLWRAAAGPRATVPAD